MHKCFLLVILDKIQNILIKYHICFDSGGGCNVDDDIGGDGSGFMFENL